MRSLIFSILLLISCSTAFTINKVQDFQSPIISGQNSTAQFSFVSKTTNNYTLTIEAQGVSCVIVNSTKCDELSIYLNNNSCNLVSLPGTFNCTDIPIVGTNNFNITLSPDLYSASTSINATIIAYIQDIPDDPAATPTSHSSSTGGGSFYLAYFSPPASPVNNSPPITIKNETEPVQLPKSKPQNNTTKSVSPIINISYNQTNELNIQKLVSMDSNQSVVFIQPDYSDQIFLGALELVFILAVFAVIVLVGLFIKEYLKQKVVKDGETK